MTGAQHAHADRASWFERLMEWNRRLVRRLVLLLAPIVLTAMVLLVIYLLRGWDYTSQIMIAGLASLLFLGTSVVLGKVVMQQLPFIPAEWIDSIHLGTWDLAYTVMWVNAASAFWYTYNLDLAQRLPGVGPWLRNVRAQAASTLRQRPWIRRLSALGVGFFVVSPLPGSGALGGSIIGHLLGMRRFSTFLIVAISGVIVCTLYAMFGDWVGKALETTPWYFKAAGILVLGILLIWLLRRAARAGRTAPPTDFAP